MTTPTTVQVRLQIRADTAANWTSVNPILLTNELGLESDTKKFKIGNGTSAWVDLAYFPSIVSGGTVLGNLEIGTAGTLTFEGSTANGFETTLGVVDPTADRTILLPNQSGTVVVGGNASIVDADIAANAEIAVSKLADGAARQLLQTDAAGTGVEWTSNIDIPGTLDVTGAATFDGAVTVAGDLTVNGTTTTISTQNLLVEDKNIILGDVATPTDVTADGGGITLKGATDKTINWIDATDAWTSSERFSVPLGSASAPSLTFTGDPNTGIYSPGADQVAISTNGVGRLLVDADGRLCVGGASTLGTVVVSTAGGAPVNLGVFRETVNGADFRISSPATASQYISGSALGDTVLRAAANNLIIGVSDATKNITFGTPSSERMRLDSSGRLGVGTSSPGATLHVNGGSASRTGYFVSTDASAYSPTSYSQYHRLYLQGGSATNAYNGIGFTNGSNSEGFIGFVQNASGYGDFVIQSYAGSYAEKLRVTSAGNVGVGTTSPGALLHLRSTSARLFCENSSTGETAEFGVDATGALIQAGGAKSAVFYTNGSERLRIDSSGRLLVGTSSSVGNGSAVQVIGPNAVEVFRYSAATGNSGPNISLTRSASNTVGTVAAVAATDDLGQVTFRGAGNGTTFVEGASIRATVESGTVSGSSLPTRLVFSVTRDGQASPTEAMRITNTGFLKASSTGGYYVATGEYHEFRTDKNLPIIYATNTNASGAIYGVQLYFAGQAPNNTASYFLNCEDTTAVRATIRSNGGLANYQANDVNLSDRNAKKDISPAAGTWDCIKEWEIVNYRYKDQPDDAGLNLGVIAQQVAESCPEVITVFQEATEDEPEKLGVKEQQMYWMAIKALQEAQVRIETLEAKVAAFESA